MSNSADCSATLLSTHWRLLMVDEHQVGDVNEHKYVSVDDFLRVKGRGDIYREGLYILYM